MDVDTVDGAMVSKARVDESMQVKLHSSDRISGPARTLEKSASASNITNSASSLSSSGSQQSLTSSTSGVSSMDGDSNAIVSVRDKIKRLNKNISDSDLTRARPNGTGISGKKGRQHNDHDDSSDIYVSLTPEEKNWLTVCASSNYHEMNRLLSKNSTLAKLKDISNGYTALHWAAKSGKSEVIKLLANKPGVYVDQRSHGGYTPLHLAAIHGHENILELLVLVYKADVNKRDFSGKKAKQYLKNSSSINVQQLLVTKKSGSDLQGSSKVGGDSLLRLSSPRASSRSKGVSSLLLQTVSKQPFLNWGNDLQDGKDGSAQRISGDSNSVASEQPPEINVTPATPSGRPAEINVTPATPSARPQEQATPL